MLHAPALKTARQREGRQFRTGRSTRQRSTPATTARESSIPRNIKEHSQEAPRASTATRPKQQEGRRFQTESQDAPRASAENRPTARRSSIPNRTLHAPALHPGDNSERVVNSKEHQGTFSGSSTRQHCHASKTARRSSIPNRIAGRSTRQR